MQQRCGGGVRAVVRDVLSPDECAELTFVHRALGAAGYSPHLWTSKLSDVAYAEPALLLPLVRTGSDHSTLEPDGKQDTIVQHHVGAVHFRVPLLFLPQQGCVRLSILSGACGGHAGCRTRQGCRCSGGGAEPPIRAVHRVHGAGELDDRSLNQLALRQQQVLGAALSLVGRVL